MLALKTTGRNQRGATLAAAVLLLASSLGAQKPSVAPPEERLPKEKRQAAIAVAAAQEAMARKDYATAVTVLENFLLENPGHVDALFNLAYVYALQERTADAVDMYQQTLEVDPKLFAARVNLGLLLLKEKKVDLAAAEFQQAVELQPDDYLAQLYLATARERQGRKEEALARYRRAAALDPEAIEPRRAALALLLQSKEWDGAQRLIEEMLQLAPADADLYLDLAEVHVKQGKPEQALAAYEEYLEAVARADSSPGSTVGEIHLRAGWLARELGKTEAALEHFRAAQQLGDTHHKQAGLAEQAETLARLQRYQEAIPIYEQAVASAPNNADLLAGLGFAYLQTQNYAKAVPVLARVVQLDPERAEAYSHLASAFYLGGNLAAAIEALERRAVRAAETPGTLFLRAISYDKLKQCGPAITYYEKFLATKPDTQSDSYFQATARLRWLKKTCRERGRPVQ